MTRRIWPLVLLAPASFGQTPEQVPDPPVAVKVSVRGNDAYYLYSQQQDPQQAMPVLMVLPEPPGDSKQAGIAEWNRWFPLAAAKKWRLVVPLVAINGDPGVLLIQAVREDFEKHVLIDPERCYVAGTGVSVPGVFYVVSRLPYFWSAAVALDGNAKGAIDSDRLYASNAQLIPTLWTIPLVERRTADLAKAKLIAAGWTLTTPEKATPADAVEFLAGHRRDRFPSKVDCETGSTVFSRCYWVEVTKFNAARKNDAIRTSRINADFTASLELGAFGFNLETKGPGVQVETLPPDYKGELQLKDRIVAIGGRAIANARDYVDFMNQEKRERPVGVMVDRGRERIRLQSVIRLPDHPEPLTARIQAEHVDASKEISLVSRAVEEAKVYVPPMWVPAQITWNGQLMTSAEVAGCYQLTESAAGQVKRCDLVAPTPKPAQDGANK